MPKHKTELLPCPRCGTVPRMEYSERLELWRQYGKKGCAFCETFTAVLPDREESAEDWNRRVENEKVIYGLS